MFDVIKARDLRHVVSIEQRGTTTDAYGQQSVTWTSIASVRAKVEPFQGKEQYQAQQYQAEISHTVSIRYRSELSDPQTNATYRVVFKGRKLNITASMDIDERRIWIVLMCSEGRSDG